MKWFQGGGLKYFALNRLPPDLANAVIRCSLPTPEKLGKIRKMSIKVNAR